MHSIFRLSVATIEKNIYQILDLMLVFLMNIIIIHRQKRAVFIPKKINGFNVVD